MTKPSIEGFNPYWHINNSVDPATMAAFVEAVKHASREQQLDGAAPKSCRDMAAVMRRAAAVLVKSGGHPDWCAAHLRVALDLWVAEFDVMGVSARSIV